MRKLLITFIFFTGIFILISFFAEPAANRFETHQIEKINESTVSEAISRDIKNKEIPETNYIDSQFICQAPLETEANWVYHEESCEEAALLQVYLQETGIIMTKSEANTEVLAMLEWQRNNFGGHYDIYADKIKEMAIAYYGIDEEKIKIIYDADLEDIKRVVSQGHTIMAPVTARYLENPFYEHPGYHMLQVIGYTEDRIITNDNGTRRGKDFSYPNDLFLEAMNDSGADILYLEI